MTKARLSSAVGFVSAKVGLQQTSKFSSRDTHARRAAHLQISVADVADRTDADALNTSLLPHAGALGMLLYGSDPLEVATPNMTDYITLQDAGVLLKLLAKGKVTVATDTGLPVSRIRPKPDWSSRQNVARGPVECDLARDLVVEVQEVDKCVAAMGDFCSAGDAEGRLASCCACIRTCRGGAEQSL